MEIFLLLVLIVLVIWLNGQGNDRIKTLTNRVDELRREIAQNKEPHTAQTQSKNESSATQTPSTPAVKETPSPVESKTPTGSFPIVTEEEPKKYAPTASSPSPKQTPFNRNPKPVTPPKKTFFERNPDLEKFIGENLINKIGIAILVLGIGFFVKYAIDKDWINEYGRTAIGILCGGILLGFAHFLRLRFKAFSSVLVGGGISVLYFTIGIAFHEYHLFNQTTAFAIMVIITAFAVMLSLAYDRIELAVLSIIGGFSTPFMVSTGEGNYIILFSYMMILNVGMLALAYFKKWNIVNILSYVFTVLIYGGWLINQLNSSENPPYNGALLFASLFYLVFFCMNMAHNIKESRTFGMLDFSLLISNTFLHYAAGMAILHHVSEGYFQGMFTAGLAVFNFLFAFVLYKNQKIDKNLVYLLIGLVLSFVSLTGPIQLEGNHITLFWAAETVLLLWLSQKSGIKLMKIASCIVMLLMFFSLLMDWEQVYFRIQQTIADKTFISMTILANKGFIAGFVSVLSLFFSIQLLKKEKEEEIFKDFKTKIYKNILSISMAVLLYVTFLLELNYQLFARIDSTSASQIILGFFNTVCVISLYLFASKKEIRWLQQYLMFLGGIVLIVYMLFYNNQVALTRNSYLIGGDATLANYLFHYLTTVSILLLLFLFFKNTKKIYGLNSEMGIGLLWFTSFIVVFIASAELSHISVMASYSRNPSIFDIIKQTYKIGFPILWGVCSFALMIIGMRLKMKHLRVISLSLFLITLLKLFIFDIRGISEGGKIAAFISLGIILLIVSFMYQKLKVLILEDDAKKQKNGINP
ncbi:MAG: DUF2339 domain-containing protein [Bacteroidetes bacterium]|nr:DUF2339 domain-containing protein [Bacteroidota bacterium]